MNIAILPLGIYPMQMGGVEVLSYKQVRMLLKRGHEVFVLVRRAQGGRATTPSASYPVFQIASSAPLIGHLWYLLALTWRLFRVRRTLDVIHVQYAGYNAIPALLMRLLTGKPYVVSCQGSDLLVWGKKSSWRTILEPILSRASYVTVWSPKMKEAVVMDYGLRRERVVVLGNVIDEDEIEATLNSKSSSEPAGKTSTVFFLGSLKPVKDPITAVRAFDLVSQRVPNARLVIAGDGPCRSQIIDYVRAHRIENRVELRGSLPHREALTALRDADVLVVSSISEGGPVVAMEAMALGVPVVGTDVGGLKEQIESGRNGILVPARAPELLADAICRVLNDRQFAIGIAAEARRRVSGSGWRALASSYEQLYESAAGQRT